MSQVPGTTTVKLLPGATVKIAAGDVADPVAAALSPEHGTLVTSSAPEVHHA